MKVEEIIASMGPPPAPQQISHTGGTFNEITKVYHEMYAGGLSTFFETTWFYFADEGKMTFPKDAKLIEEVASFLRTLTSPEVSDSGERGYSGVLETRVIWGLARATSQLSQEARLAPQAVLPPWTDPIEAKHRVEVVEVLLDGEYLKANPLTPPYQDKDHHRVRQFDFWYALAEFLRRRDDEQGPLARKARDDCLGRMRTLLDGRENRDLLYSIAVVRDGTPRYAPLDGNDMPQHLDETDPRNRVAVAAKFIQDESQLEGGATNVIRRLSDIAARAYVDPGFNLTRVD